jgi:predicted transcriptional regulator
MSISSSASSFLFLLSFSPHKHHMYYSITAFIKTSAQFLIWRSTTKLSKIFHRHLHRLPSLNRDTMKKRHRRSEPRTFTVKTHYFGHSCNCCQWVDCYHLSGFSAKCIFLHPNSRVLKRVQNPEVVAVLLTTQRNHVTNGQYFLPCTCKLGRS